MRAHRSPRCPCCRLSVLWCPLAETNFIGQLWNCLNRNPAPTVPPPEMSIVPGNSQINWAVQQPDGQTSVKHFCFPNRQKGANWTELRLSSGFVFCSLFVNATLGLLNQCFYTDVTRTIQQKRQMLTECYCTVVHPHLKLCTKQLCAICETFFPQLFSGRAAIKPIPQCKFTCDPKLPVIQR